MFKMFKKYFNLNKLSTLIFYLSILTFIIAFNFSDNPASGWQQQFMPFLNNRDLRDMVFTDSLTGYGITKGGFNGDSDYVIKTTNSGNNWFIVYTTYSGMNKVKFINSTTGYICGTKYPDITSMVLKTTNSGINWIYLNAQFAKEFKDMSVLNEDTIWVTDANGLSGGIYRTNNSGLNWFNQFYTFGGNPERIYMYNSQVGFMDRGDVLWKTINGGYNWSIITGQNGFYDISFVDSLTGWKCKDSVRKTTDGGVSWIRQNVPMGGNISIF
ncbi:MAG: hypothetical protein LH629_13360, partial [Ignavibacteria bacterium]|nr:hypothetical protein [Ignavibacteria bacterium]